VRKRVVVIGAGGASGLAALHELLKAGHDVVAALEAGPCIGGVWSSRRPSAAWAHYAIVLQWEATTTTRVLLLRRRLLPSSSSSLQPPPGFLQRRGLPPDVRVCHAADYRNAAASFEETAVVAVLSTGHSGENVARDASLVAYTAYVVGRRPGSWDGVSPFGHGGCVRTSAARRVAS
jgi:cation diffusion facilitator CzcD-associated flavoprotein CzcO